MKESVLKARKIDLPGITCAARAVVFATLFLTVAGQGALAQSRSMANNTRHAVSQGAHNSATGTVPGEIDAPPPKLPRAMFGKPDKSNPTEQFAHARELEKNGRHKKARKAYNALVHAWPMSRQAASAQIGVASMDEMRGRFVDAFKEYQYFIENYGGAEMPDGLTYYDVIESQFAIANALRVKLDDGWFSAPNADTVARMYDKIATDNAPEWARADECLMLRASIFDSERNYTTAIAAYEQLINKYPRSRFVADALYRTAYCRYRISEKASRDEYTLKNAIAAANIALRAAPDHAESGATLERLGHLSRRLTAMNFARAEFYDRIRQNPEAAILAYNEFLKNYPGAAEARHARERLAELAKLTNTQTTEPAQPTASGE